jgi:hypothetical protein
VTSGVLSVTAGGSDDSVPTVAGAELPSFDLVVATVDRVAPL